MNEIIFIVLGLVAGGGAGAFVMQSKIKNTEKNAGDAASKMIREAEEKKSGILDAARKEAERIDRELKEDEKARREKIDGIEKRLISREEQLDQKLEKLDESRNKLEEKVEELKKQEEAVKVVEEKAKTELERISGLKKEDAKDVLLKKYEAEFEPAILAHIKKMEERAEQETDKKAKNMLTLAIQKYANEVASESMATIVNIPDDDMKGRIIGREGRNINTFERLTGVDVIVDDTPGSILISGFDLMRRFVAKKSLETLLEDGRIHPARIEEVVEKVKQDTEELVVEFGEKALMELGITGIHPNLVKLAGRMRFRTSYGQNVLKHCMEVAYLASSLAAEVGADVKLAKIAGFFHDIGKAVTHEIEGSHAIIGAAILRKFGMDEKLVNCVEAHHNEVPQGSLEAHLVMAADAISGARPGARSDSIENYIKRLLDLEAVAGSFEGVAHVYAIQAGREVRVFVNPEEVSDLEALTLAKNIATKIEGELQYPGEIKVNVIRENRVIEFAR